MLSSPEHTRSCLDFGLSLEHEDSQGRSLSRVWEPHLGNGSSSLGHYLRALAIKEQDLGYDVLIKPGEELSLGSVEGHSSIDDHDISLAQALFPRKKTLKTRRGMKNMAEGGSFPLCLFLILRTSTAVKK